MSRYIDLIFNVCQKILQQFSIIFFINLIASHSIEEVRKSILVDLTFKITKSLSIISSTLSPKITALLKSHLDSLTKSFRPHLTLFNRIPKRPHPIINKLHLTSPPSTYTVPLFNKMIMTMINISLLTFCLCWWLTTGPISSNRTTSKKLTIHCSYGTFRFLYV